METREDYLLRLASGLEGLATDERLIVRDPYIERAFGSTRALAIAEAGVFAARMGARFVTTASSAKESSPVHIRQAAGREVARRERALLPLVSGKAAS